MRSLKDLIREPSMNEIIRVAIDTSKSVFQVHGVDAAERPVLRKRLRRREVLPFFAKLKPTRIGLEACGGAHHWARELKGLGHDAVLMPPQLITPYVQRNKNDGRDAEAGCEAMGRPRMRFVPVKSAEQQAAQMLLGVRDRLVRCRTQLANAIRGHAAEFGLVAPKGLSRIEPLLARIAGDASVPDLAKDLFAIQSQEYAALAVRLRDIEARLMAWHRNNEMSRRLAEVQGIGPIGAAMLVMKVPDPAAFRCGRDLAAWLGLTPKDHSTADKQRLGAITRAGDEELRRVLVAGATSVIQKVKYQHRPGSPWLVDLIDRKPRKLAAVALANKNVRVAWRLMVSGERYDPHRQTRMVAPVGAGPTHHSWTLMPATDQHATVLAAVNDKPGGGPKREPSLTAAARGGLTRLRSGRKNACGAVKQKNGTKATGSGAQPAGGSAPGDPDQPRGRTSKPRVNLTPATASLGRAHPQLRADRSAPARPPLPNRP
jgi:transposase